MRVQSKIVFFNAWYNAGIITIGDLKDPEGKIMSYDKFSAKYRVRSNFVQYNSIISAIPFTWEKVEKATSMATPPILDKLCNAVKPSKYVYNTVISQSAQFPNHLIEKWKEEMSNQDIDADTLVNSFQKLYASTISTKIRSFQYRMIHRIIGINAKLCRWGIQISNLCDLCKSQEETYHHLFYECGKVVPFWTSVKAWTR